MTLFNALALLFGLYLAGRGVYRLFPILQYFMGWRRDIYFMPIQDWARLIRDYLGSMALGVGIVSLQMLWTISLGLAGLGFAIGVFCALALSTWAYRAVPRRPRWVRRFEEGRSVEEVTYIRECGSRVMRNEPRRFARVLNSPGGWDAWLMTVI